MTRVQVLCTYSTSTVLCWGFSSMTSASVSRYVVLRNRSENIGGGDVISQKTRLCVVGCEEVWDRMGLFFFWDYLSQWNTIAQPNLSLCCWMTVSDDDDEITFIHKGYTKTATNLKEEKARLPLLQTESKHQK